MVTQELLDFIQSARTQGKADEDISQSLLQVGWEQSSVSEGLEYNANQAVPAQIQTSIHTGLSKIIHMPYFWMLAIITLLVIVGISGYVFFYVMTLSNTTMAPSPLQPGTVTTQQKVVSTSTSTVASTSTPPTTKATTSVPKTQSNLSKINVCSFNDINCLIAAARTCTPTTTKLSTSIPLFGLIISGTTTITLSRAKTPGDCNYVSKVDAAKVTMSAKGEKTALAHGMTQAQIQAQVTKSNKGAQKTIGTTRSCTFSTSQLIGLLTRELKGHQYSSSDFPKSECVTVMPGFSSERWITVYLSNGGVSINGMGFKVVSLTNTLLTVIITNSKIGKSASVVFAPGQTKTVLGKTMKLQSIKNMNSGTSNGQKTYTLTAALMYLAPPLKYK